MSRVGAIDCGTNSIRLLIAETGDSLLRDVHREMRIVRLGQGVDATGQFAPEALARTRAALSDYADLLRSHDVERIRMVATSAARDVSNREEFFAMTADLLGAVQPGAVAEVISGAQEAELSFNGAVAELDSAAGPFVVVDLGGGLCVHGVLLASEPGADPATMASSVAAPLERRLGAQDQRQDRALPPKGDSGLDRGGHGVSAIRYGVFGNRAEQLNRQHDQALSMVAAPWFARTPDS